MDMTPYKHLAECLDALPNGFPPTQSGVELRLLAKIFAPDEATLAAQLHAHPETPDEIAARIGGDPMTLRQQLKSMARRGLIAAYPTGRKLEYGLLPFVVGIYEMQLNNMDAELARLFEDYFQDAFSGMLAIKPQFHRIVPVGQSIRSTMEVRPYETAAELVDAAQAWAVQDCICRKQKALIGEPCEHPIDVCMALSSRPGAFDHAPTMRALTREEALATLRRAADAGLVHSVSNNQKDIYYICNCCTCSCAILRGMAKLGKANVMASSAFVNQVDETLCIACEECIEHCQFDALTVDTVAHVNLSRCVGCGVCVLACPSEALGLVRRPAEEVLPVPETMGDWFVQRTAARRVTEDLTS
jgi:electron transport complex protein RnfB